MFPKTSMGGSQFRRPNELPTFICRLNKNASGEYFKKWVYGLWLCDYTPIPLDPPPFTTIAWIMHHLAQTADMYLYCVKSGQPEGIDWNWDELPVPSSFEAMKSYSLETLAEVQGYLRSIPEMHIHKELNKLTPAPWGEMRPTYLNIWGGVIEHTIQHAMQITARKERMRYG